MDFADWLDLLLLLEVVEDGLLVFEGLLVNAGGWICNVG